MERTPRTMEKRIAYVFAVALLTALFALLGLSLFAADKGLHREVIITGRILVEDLQVNDVLLVVEVDDHRCLYAELLDNGRFTIAVPAGSQARLSFLKPGHVAKEVLVDTRNAQNSAEAQRANKKVKFDVVLESQELRAGRAYMGAVGTVSFTKGTGTMAVRHHTRMTPNNSVATNKY